MREGDPSFGPRTAPRHVMGQFRGGESGPLLVGIGGLHGNEPSGVEALRRVLDRLDEVRPPFRGTFVALSGNHTALRRERRFVARDLNRIWTLERVRQLEDGGGPASPTPEDREQAELLAAIEDVLSLRRERGVHQHGAAPHVYFLDLHTTSSESVPFVTFSDTLRNRAFAAHFPIPLVLGVEEELHGTLLDYVNHLGHVALGVEGGSHTDPASVDHLEVATWLGLVAAGNLDLVHVPEGAGLRRRLARAARGVPQIFEVRYRHALRRGDGFRMEPGFRNFQRVEAGQLLARDRRGEIRAPESGRLFLPLYQSQGEEGFFIVREVAAFWLRLSAWLRRLRVDALARWLPGVHLHPEREHALVVHPRVARPLMVKLFHLLGYRRERPENGKLVLTRRKETAEGLD